MLQINISTQPIRLDYQIQNAKLNLQTTPPLLDIQTTPAIMEIQQPHGVLTIDGTPCRYSIGLKNNADFAQDNAALARQSVIEGIGRAAEEGRRLTQIENKTNAIAEIAAESNVSELPDITWAHVDAPIIHYEASPVQFNPIAGRVNYNLKPGTVQGDYQRGSVNIQVIQYPSIEMSVVDVKV